MKNAGIFMKKITFSPRRSRSGRPEEKIPLNGSRFFGKGKIPPAGSMEQKRTISE